MEERWLITGGCGFIGSNLAARLLSTGREVVVVDTLVRSGSEANLAWLKKLVAPAHSGQLIHVSADTRSQTDLEDVFQREGPTLNAVVHLAGQVAMTTSLSRPRFDFEVNALGAINVLEAVRAFSPKATILFSSTNKVYGDLKDYDFVEKPTRWEIPTHPEGLDETTPLSFESPYGCSKGAADQYFLDYHRMFGLKTAVFRHSSIYGGRQYATFDQGWIGWFCQQIQKQARFTVSGDGKQVRDVLHADDIVDCYLAAHTHIEKCKGRAYNIGGGMANSLSLLELFELLKVLTGHSASFDRLPWRQSDQRFFVANIGAARKDFGWFPAVTHKEGLRRMLDWTRTL